MNGTMYEIFLSLKFKNGFDSHQIYIIVDFHFFLF